MNIDLDTAEALIVLGAVQDKQLEASRLAAIADGDEQLIADLAAKILGRVAKQITAGLYPDTCRWLDDEACERPIASMGLCTLHLAHKARVAEILSA